MAGSVGKKASALVASDPDKKRLAEKSFTSYVRAIQLMPNKQVRRGWLDLIDALAFRQHFHVNSSEAQCRGGQEFA